MQSISCMQDKTQQPDQPPGDQKPPPTEPPLLDGPSEGDQLGAGKATGDNPEIGIGKPQKTHVFNEPLKKETVVVGAELPPVPKFQCVPQQPHPQQPVAEPTPAKPATTSALQPDPKQPLAEPTPAEPPAPAMPKLPAVAEPLAMPAQPPDHATPATPSNNELAEPQNAIPVQPTIAQAAVKPQDAMMPASHAPAAPAVPATQPGQPPNAIVAALAMPANQPAESSIPKQPMPAVPAHGTEPATIPKAAPPEPPQAQPTPAPAPASDAVDAMLAAVQQNLHFQQSSWQHL